MPDPEVQIIDERRITVKKAKYDEGKTEQIGKFIANAGQDGYVLADMKEEKTYEDRPGGSYFNGVTLIFRKAS